MARVDDFKMSFDLAAQELANRNLSEIAEMSGAEAAVDQASLSLAYYGRPLKVSTGPVGVAAQDGGPELPLAEQALVLHYLVRAAGRKPSGQWITFREVPSGEFYWSAFVKRAKDPLVKFFGQRPQHLLELAPLVGGRAAPDQAGDAAVIVQAFPRVPLFLQLWAGDEEFPPEGNVLFDQTIAGYLSTEDIALAAGLPIYKMMALAKAQQEVKK